MLKKPINIQSLLDSYAIKDESIRKMYLVINNIEFKPHEVPALSTMVSQLKEGGLTSAGLSYYFVDYIIPQIGKQFDLLRLGKNYNLNLELKTESTLEKIEEQLVQNRQYLSVLEKECKHLTFWEDKKVFYLLGDRGIQEVDTEAVIQIISNQTIGHNINIDALFEPTQFLVSPFANDDRFINGKYFLNNQQLEFKVKLQNGESRLYRVTGKPGTGKTLLVYDFAKEEILNKKKVAIIHGGNLNSGHWKLKNIHGWKIFPAIEYKKVFELNPDFIIIDEAQRFYRTQFKEVEEYINSNLKCKLIISYDKEQILAKWENDSSLAGIIDSLVGYENLNLTTKVRTNIEMATFIKGLFNLRCMGNVTRLDNVAIQYFEKYDEATEFIELLENEDWHMINYTPPKYDGKDIQKMVVSFSRNAHGVIGQEYDKVVAIMGENFYYDGNNLKYYNDENKYYSPMKMFYQIVTRTRKKLMLIIVNNEELFGRLLKSFENVEKRVNKSE